jgi:hypothetical protein
VKDELREQLRRLDPMHSGVPVESSTTPSSQARLEKIMNTPLIDKNKSDSTSDHKAATVSTLATLGAARRRTWTIVAGVAAAAVVAFGSAAVIGNSGGSGGSAAATPLELSLGDSDTLSSCMMFDVALLAEMSPAFAGTATAVDGDTVTLTVDRWYTGGDANTVVLRGSGESVALIGGFDFEVGQQYLITAAEGNVNFCGYSGIATPELTAAFDAAFGS